MRRAIGDCLITPLEPNQVWPLNLRFAGQYCSILKLKAWYCREISGNHSCRDLLALGNQENSFIEVSYKEFWLGSMDYGHEVMARSGGEIRQPW